ncbi:glycosyltransferase family 2 protein [Simonsiella muelleri]|uniref:glycosyltransferase family 2 protein n=1 Tax=Simonsiella muelleri TaxID=72 RepID=UPI0028D5B587|nr:glycosyltransferase family 2 protein [Simonsiella muelleri]
MNLDKLLTIALITKNEAKHLPDCLASVQDLGCPIVIIDSGSSDTTPEIAEQFGAAFHVFTDWQGFGTQRNRAHAFIQTPWVLWLDADERLGETTRQDLIQRISQIIPDGKVLFSINRLSIAYGREIRHSGWYPDRIVRCYPVAQTQYSDDLVHESVLVSNGVKVVELKGDVLHDTYADLNQHLEKMKQYAFAWAAQRQGKKSATPFSAAIRAVFAFLRFYFLKRGFLDGQQGLMIATMNAVYTFLKYAQLWQLNRSKSGSLKG